MSNYIDIDTVKKGAIWELLTENSIATDSEIELVTCINGYSEESLLDILFARTGYRSIEQILDSEECFYIPAFFIEESEEEI